MQVIISNERSIIIIITYLAYKSVLSWFAISLENPSQNQDQISVPASIM